MDREIIQNVSNKIIQLIVSLNEEERKVLEEFEVRIGNLGGEKMFKIYMDLIAKNEGVVSIAMEHLCSKNE